MRKWLEGALIIFAGLVVTTILHNHLLIGSLAGFAVCVIGLGILTWNERRAKARTIAKDDLARTTFGELLQVGEVPIGNLEEVNEQMSRPAIRKRI